MRRTIGAPVQPPGALGKALQFLFVALVGGIGSAWYAIEWGATPGINVYGPWRTWPNLARPDIDPYTRARLLNRQRLVLDAGVATTFEAEVDDTGQDLHSACEYRINAPRIEAPWWRLAVFTRDGRLIANRADRHHFGQGSAVTEVDGSVVVQLSREARSGNWLPTGGGGPLTLVLTVADNSGDRPSSALRLPSIARVACR